MFGCCKLLVSESFVLAGQRSGHNVPVNLQQDKCYSLFCNFFSLHEWKSVIPLKVRAWRMGSPVYFRLWATFLTCSKSSRIQRLKEKKQIQYGVRFVLLCDTKTSSASGREKVPKASKVFVYYNLF